MDGMRKLGCRVAAEVTDTRSFLVDRLNEFTRGLRSQLLEVVFMLGILTEKTVQRASEVKNSQVFIPVFCSLAMSIVGITSSCSPSTYPIPHTICRQRIVIPGKVTFFWKREQSLPVLVFPYATVTLRVFSNPTPVKTVRTRKGLFLLGGNGR